MAKRKQTLLQCPDSVWHTTGRSLHPDQSEAVRERLQELSSGDIQVHREFTAIDAGGSGLDSRAFDAGWRTEDGARISARLHLFQEAAHAQALGRRPGFGWWSLTAEADRPWNMSWPSPTSMFFPPAGQATWGRDWFAGALRMGMSSVMNNSIAEDMADILTSFSQAPWYTVVITHDRRPMKDCIEQAGPDLVSMLPEGFLGRVLEIRAHGQQDRFFNKALESHRVSLPWGGAVILPTTPRKDGMQRSEYSIAPEPGGTFEKVMVSTALRVAQYAALPGHYHENIRAAVRDLREDWVLREVELTSEHVLAQKAEIEDVAARLREELAAVRERLQGEEELRVKAEKAAREAEQAREEMLRAAREDPLAERARETEARLEDVAREADAAQLLLDNQTAEIGWLRRQLAQVPGRSYAEPAPERPPGPGSWRELADLAVELMPHVCIGDIWGPLDKLRDNEMEKLWMRRAWDALEALEAYGEAKAKHGPAILPNFTAYLQWPEATALVSLQTYKADEGTVRRRGLDSKWYRMRYLPIPGQRQVFMGEHFRIGGIKPPAPRMHVYDDTSGETGQIHVGYLGPHLPNHVGR